MTPVSPAQVEKRNDEATAKLNAEASEVKEETAKATVQESTVQGPPSQPPKSADGFQGESQPEEAGSAGREEDVVTEYYADGKIYEADKFADFFETPTDVVKRGDVLGDGKTRERFVLGESSYYAMRVTGELTIGKIDLYDKDGEVVGIYKVYDEPVLGFVGQVGERDSLAFEDVVKGRKLNALLKELEGKEPVGTIVTDKLLFGYNVENGNPAVKHLSKNRAFVSRAGMKLSEKDVNVLKIFKVLLNSGTQRISELGNELVATLEADGQESKILKNYAKEVADLLKKGLEEGNLHEVLPQIRTAILKSHAALQKSLMPKDAVIAEIGEDSVKFREQKRGLKTDIEDYKGKVVVFLKVPSPAKETNGYDKLVAVGDDLNALSVNKKGLALLFQASKVARGIWNMVAKQNRSKASDGKFGFKAGVELLQKAKEDVESYLNSKIYAKEVDYINEVINRFLSVRTPKEARMLYYGENEFGKKVRDFVNGTFESLKVFNSIVDGSFAKQYVKEEAEPKGESYLAIKLRGVKFYEESPGLPLTQQQQQQEKQRQEGGDIANDPNQRLQSGSGPKPPKP